MPPSIPERFDSLGSGFKSFMLAPPEDVVRFTVGEPGFDTPEKIVEAAVDALRAGLTHYTRGEGNLELCRAVAERLQGDYGIPLGAEDVVITPGCKQALLYSMMVSMEPGDELILFAPAWPTYAAQARLLGLIPIQAPCHHSDFHPDFEALEALITPRTKAMLVNSPNNPTGAVLREDEIQQLVDIAEQHDLWLISDEIYSRMVWTAGGHISPAALPGGFERTIVVTGWSKSFAMTGWRLGILAGPSRIVKAAAKCQANACSHVPTFLMPAGLAALDESVDEVVDEFCEAYLNRRKLLMQGLEGVPGLKMADPEGAFYAFVDITGTEMDSITFATRALDEARVQLIPGALMEGGEGFVRISYACAEEEIIEGSRRLSEWLSNL